ncbi:unnamed protein product [Wickerhamomyces anomalus]
MKHRDPEWNSHLITFNVSVFGYSRYYQILLLTFFLDTLSEVESHWSKTIGDNANPLDIALPLLDNTSVGLAHRRREFLDLKDRISNGLRQAVNEHFQAFNDSVGSYRSVVQNIANSQHTLTKVKDTINSTTNGLNEKGDTMNTLNENLKTYNDMIEVLNVIENLKKVPNELEDAISEKNYSKAQFLLQTVSSKSKTYSLWELPALSNLESYFQLQTQQLFEILIEEIHNIIYSKKLFNTFNSANEVGKDSDISDYSNIEKYLMNAIDVDILETASVNHSNIENFLSFLINSSSKNKEDSSQLDNENDMANMVALDDVNPFNQLLHLFTIIYRLDKLPTAIEIIIQRNANEINQLVNRITEDTKLRHPKIIKYLNSNIKSKDLSRGLGIDDSLNDDNFKTMIVRDLFWNFFRKLLFLIQSVRVILEIIKSLENDSFETVSVDVSNLNGSSPHGSNDSLLTLIKLWHSLKFEVKNFITSYITNNDLSLSSKLTNTSSIINQKDKMNNNALFQFYKVNYDEDHSNQLKLVLQDLFPGFINSNDMSKIDSPYIEDTKFLKQTRIIPANIFHMRVILEPFLVFIQGSKLLLNEQDNDEPIKFFNGFMNNDFLPLLEESFIGFYIDEVEELDPYEIYDDVTEKSTNVPHSQSSGVKIFKIFIEFKRFFSDICFVLNTSLQFRKEFSGIIFKILNKFHDKIEEFNQELLNELSNYFEPNREIIKALNDPSAKISEQALIHLNKHELKRLKIIENFKVLDNSLKFLLEWFENHLIKKVDLNKTDLNLSTIEKLRKNWSFFEINNLRTIGTLHENELDLKHSIKVILNDQLTENFTEIVHDYKTIENQVQNVLKRYNQLIKA